MYVVNLIIFKISSFIITTIEPKWTELPTRNTISFIYLDAENACYGYVAQNISINFWNNGGFILPNLQ